MKRLTLLALATLLSSLSGVAADATTPKKCKEKVDPCAIFVIDENFIVGDGDNKDDVIQTVGQTVEWAIRHPKESPIGVELRNFRLKGVNTCPGTWYFRTGNSDVPAPRPEDGLKCGAVIAFENSQSTKLAFKADSPYRGMTFKFDLAVGTDPDHKKWKAIDPQLEIDTGSEKGFGLLFEVLAGAALLLLGGLLGWIGRSRLGRH